MAAARAASKVGPANRPANVGASAQSLGPGPARRLRSTRSRTCPWSGGPPPPPACRRIRPRRRRRRRRRRRAAAGPSGPNRGVRVARAGVAGGRGTARAGERTSASMRARARKTRRRIGDVGFEHRGGARACVECRLCAYTRIHVSPCDMSTSHGRSHIMRHAYVCSRCSHICVCSRCSDIMPTCGTGRRSSPARP